MNSVVRMLCDSLENMCDAMEAGKVGQPGDALYDELDAAVTILAYVRDRIDEPAAYLTLATKDAAAGQLMAAMHTSLLNLADAKRLLTEVICDAEVERADASGRETATMPDDAEYRAAV